MDQRIKFSPGSNHEPGLKAYDAAREIIWGGGGFPERSKGSDCKSDGNAFEGSNPSLPTGK